MGSFYWPRVSVYRELSLCIEQEWVWLHDCRSQTLHAPFSQPSGVSKMASTWRISCWTTMDLVSFPHLLRTVLFAQHVISAGKNGLGTRLLWSCSANDDLMCCSPTPYPYPAGELTLTNLVFIATAKVLKVASVPIHIRKLCFSLRT